MLAEGDAYSLALLGFSTDISRSMRETIEESDAEVKINYEEIADTIEEFSVGFDREFDIILINSVGYKNNPHEVIRELKREYPLTECILIAFRPSYALAMNAFRAGVRDILEYPVEPRELKAAIDRAVSYRSVFQQSKSLSEVMGLLNIMGNYRQFESKRELFHTLASYLNERYGTQSFEVFKQTGTAGDVTRFWSDRKLVFQDPAVPIAIIQEIASSPELDHNHSHARPQAGGPVIVFRLGTKDDAHYWCAFTIQKHIKDDMPLPYVMQFVDIIRNAFYYQMNNEERQIFASLASHDDVTGLFNQRKLFIDLDEALQRYEEKSESFSVLFMDIDHFKMVNDGRGHINGSMILVELAQLLKKTVRETDLIYRYGGDEFVVVFHNTKSDAVFPVAERILNSVQKQNFLVSSGTPYKLTVSIGISEFPRDADSKAAIIAIADQMMYEAKRGGRARICSTSEFLKKA